jgi:hypothetical protein
VRLVALAQVVLRTRLIPAECDPLLMNDVQEKPSWVDALEESLLLAIGLFTFITWIVMIGLLAH